LQTALILAALILYCRAGESDSRLAACGALLLLVSLNRVEGIGVYAIFLGYTAMTARNWRKVGALAIGVAPYLLFLLCRHGYYGYWLPNTYYAKVGTGVLPAMHGLKHALGFVESAFGCLLFASAALLYGLLFHRAKLLWRLSALTLLAGMALTVAGGGHNLPLWRYMNPYFPQAVLLFVFFLEGARRAPVLSRVAAGLVTALAILGGLADALSRSSVVTLVDGNRKFYHASRIAGEFAAQLLEPSQAVAMNAIPFFSYYYGGRVIDMLGLVDSHIAHRQVSMGQRPHGHEKGDGRYVLGQLPDLILFGGEPALAASPAQTDPDPKRSWSLSDVEILIDSRFRQLYEPCTFQLGRVYLNVHCRKAGRFRSVRSARSMAEWRPDTDEPYFGDSWFLRVYDTWKYWPVTWPGKVSSGFRRVLPVPF
jgi:hypothetical protein